MEWNRVFRSLQRSAAVSTIEYRSFEPVMSWNPFQELLDRGSTRYQTISNHFLLLHRDTLEIRLVYVHRGAIAPEPDPCR